MATDELGLRLHGTTDGETWAEEFLKQYSLFRRNKGGVLTEADAMDAVRGWFANAIECGRSHGYTAGAARTERIDTGEYEYERGRREGWNAAARSARQAWKDAHDLPEGAEVFVLEHAIVDDLTKRALHREGGLPVPPGVQVPSTRDMAKRYVTLMKRLAAGEKMTLGKPFWEESPAELHQRLRGPHPCGEECPWYDMPDPACVLRCLNCGYVGDRTFVQRHVGGPRVDVLSPDGLHLKRGAVACAHCNSEDQQLLLLDEPPPKASFWDAVKYNKGDSITMNVAGQEVKVEIVHVTPMDDGSVQLITKVKS